ncbi:MAG: HD domain-containing protein, partial [Bacteroidales bacterium]
MELLIKYHDNKTTIVGTSIIIHALDVAHTVLIEMGLGISAVTGTIIHYIYDSLKDRREELIKTFGNSTLIILEGLAKISAIDSTPASYQSESFRKL